MIRSFLKGGIFYKTPQLHENASISKDSDIVNKWYVDTKVNNTQIDTKQYIDGQINSLNTTVNVVVKDSSIPKGAIIMWSGSIATIPSGWALCNGANGTPDLRNRFVIGSSSDVSGVSNTSVTGANTKSGGSKDAIVVAHTHSGTANSGTGGGNFVSDLYYGAQPNHFFRTGTGGAGSGYIHKSVASAGAHTHSLTINSTGSSGTNANLPPYYALAFIMKL
jgi:microcystin-dependent protein